MHPPTTQLNLMKCIEIPEIYSSILLLISYYRPPTALPLFFVQGSSVLDQGVAISITLPTRRSINLLLFVSKQEPS